MYNWIHRVLCRSLATLISAALEEINVSFDICEKESLPSEESLIASAKKGDELAFALLAKSYKRVLDFHIRQIDHDPSIYDDLFQEGLIGLLKAVRNYDGKSSAFSTFASLCVRNSIISGVRKYASQTSKTVSVPDIIEDDRITPSAEEVHFDSERVKLLFDQVFSALSPFEKTVFELYLADMPYESIAFATGKSVRSIQNAVFRIRTKLKQIVGNADNLPH